MVADFKKFILRGNLVEIAVGLILALAFSLVVNSFVDDVLMQIIAAIGGQPDFGQLTINLGDEGQIFYGRFLNAVINFVIVGFVLFLLMKGYNAMVAARKRGIEDPEEIPEDIQLLREIRDSLQRPVS